LLKNQESNDDNYCSIIKIITLEIIECVYICNNLKELKISKSNQSINNKLI